VRRIGIFGWGLVAPRSPNIEAFARNLESSESWLEPFNGFGPDTFLVGVPEFSWEDYRSWIDARFKPARFSQIESKMGMPSQYAIGAFIQALGQNPGLEEELQRLGPRTRIYVGTGVGDIPTQYEQSLNLYHAQRRWNRFWADPVRNQPLRDYLEGKASPSGELPPSPESVPDIDRVLAEDAWWGFWAQRSPQLGEYLAELREIEALPVEGEVEAGKMAVIKEKRRRLRKLEHKFRPPMPPWQAVSSNMIWNIHNIPAAQISMLGRLTGMTIAPVAACSTFGVALKLAVDAIVSGDADAVVLGATDPPPHPLMVGAFYNTRVISADAQVSKPLTELRGTHVAGGAVIWIVGELEHMTARGMRPLGMEPIGVGVTSDAAHIITPSKHGPTAAMHQAMGQSHLDGQRIVAWDLHATATPGDFMEVELVRELMPEDVVFTARKGTFGHGMSAGGGWELTAQYLGYERHKIYRTPLRRDELHAEIARLHGNFAFDTDCAAPDGVVGKLSMGIGGINACVISRPWPEEPSPPSVHD